MTPDPSSGPYQSLEAGARIDAGQAVYIKDGKVYPAELAAAEPEVTLTACCCRCVTESGKHFPFMLTCSICGNKRCPHANDHRHFCTHSNAPGQAGSAYP